MATHKPKTPRGDIDAFQYGVDTAPAWFTAAVDKGEIVECPIVTAKDRKPDLVNNLPWAEPNTCQEGDFVIMYSNTEPILAPGQVDPASLKDVKPVTKYDFMKEVLFNRLYTTI